ncbi:hypothetical protein P0D69_42800, partial [Paraburkholderia sediminicola]|uniref:hypothetical protein n=1 Tax=Paraburkholderia sediminicola TaxID=458836 RepID=UPI0038B93478
HAFLFGKQAQKLRRTRHTKQSTFVGTYNPKDSSRKSVSTVAEVAGFALSCLTAPKFDSLSRASANAVSPCLRRQRQ